MASSGFFITLESIDGLGKTTQAKRLVENLQAEGHDVVFTKEPGDHSAGSSLGPGIRKLLFKDPTTHKMRPGVADLLFLADHLQNAGDVAEYVTQGKIVVSDRHADSQYAYAGGARANCPPEIMDTYRKLYGIKPDLTILLRARGELKQVPYDTAPGALHPSNLRMIEDISWALNRAKSRQGDEAGKQEGKAWSDQLAQWRIQEQYLFLLHGLPRTWVIDVHETTTKADLAATILIGVLLRMNTQPTVSQEQAA